MFVKDEPAPRGQSGAENRSDEPSQSQPPVSSMSGSELVIATRQRCAKPPVMANRAARLILWTKDEIIADLQRQNLELRGARDKELPVIKALWKRAASFWPPAAPFDEKDVVVVFRSKEDANEFSEALAFMGQVAE